MQMQFSVAVRTSNYQILSKCAKRINFEQKKKKNLYKASRTVRLVHLDKSEKVKII